MNHTCVRCVMDVSDPDISFDHDGVCNHCHEYDIQVARRVRSGSAGQAAIASLVDEIRVAGRGREYDCVLGVSGGVDSTYVAWKARELGLRPIAVHLDNGWDSELAVKNIEATLRTVGIPLHTVVLDWEEFRDLQLAFLRAGTPDSEIPTDHAIFATLFRTARRFGVRHILGGGNARTESHLPPAWSQGHFDWRYIRAVHRRFGSVPLRSFPHESALGLLWNRWRVRLVNVLDLLDYRKQDALTLLQERLGWRYYGGKHYESIYTRWYQGCLLPRKFGFDKRRSHLSSLICSGEITRDAALAELSNPTYPMALQAEDHAYVAKKLGISADQLEEIVTSSPRRFAEYPSYTGLAKRPPGSWALALAHALARRRRP